MSKPIQINDQVSWIGVNDHDTGLFEELWPMPHGITYNSYLIRDERTALIDTVKGSFSAGYVERIKKLLGDGSKIDYLIINHIEPDHSGAIKVLLEVFPGIQIVGNKKTAGLLADFYGITENLRIVEDGDELNLGRYTLKFLLTPMVHWPETMMTYEPSQGLLFSGDAFGGFSALDDGIFDDDINDLPYYEEEILRYFTNVLGKYSLMVQKALSRLQELEIRLIAPSHGPVWRKDPHRIIRLYDRWSRHEADEGVTIVYASMYGNTGEMMEAVARSLSREHVGGLVTHNLSRSHISHIIADVWKHKALVLGTPTYNTMPFPLMDHFMRVMENKGLKDRIMGIFGSYGWVGGALKELTDFGQRMKWELIGPVVEAKCAPSEENLAACEQLGKNIASRLRELRK
jgi:flavorubredoxin